MKKLLIILIFVIFLVGCSYEEGVLTIDFNKFKTNEPKSINQYEVVDILELTENTEKYYNKTITIQGKFATTRDSVTWDGCKNPCLANKGGYKIRISCPRTDELIIGNIYIAEGYLRDDNIFICDKPLTIK